MGTYWNVIEFDGQLIGNGKDGDFFNKHGHKYEPHDTKHFDIDSLIKEIKYLELKGLAEIIYQKECSLEAYQILVDTEGMITVYQLIPSWMLIRGGLP